MPADIARLLKPFLGDEELTPAQVAAVSTYLDLLVRWNARVNLTAVRAPEMMLTRHFGESFFAARQLFSADANAGNKSPTLADVGSGAGFPGLPAKILRPQISLSLIESNHKKAAFLNEVIRALNLSGAQVMASRAEHLPQAGFDVVTLRAVERFDAVLPVAAALVTPGGRIALLIGRSQVDAARDALAGWKWQAPLPMPQSEARVLLIGAQA